ncbi:NAD(P)-dependent oxidoreductase [Vibrio parahaemolyticus]|nr:NAD(P)-dependent oxidoreductase [Vibrio parahaemolyticus]
MKNILITGCNGMLGRRFIELYSSDFNITALGRNEVTYPVDNVNYKISDYSSDSLNEIFLKQDVVIHLAASRLYKGNDCYKENTFLDAKVFQAAELSNVPHIIFASTRGVYGGKGPWKEVDAISPDNSYSFGKAQSELLAQYYSKIKGQRITILRLAQILSDREYEGSLLRTFFDQAAEGINLNCTVSGIFREYIYLDDAVSAIKTVIDSDTFGGIYNLGNGESLSIKAIAEIIAETYGVIVQEPVKLKKMDELSLMDSSLFRSKFKWSPKYTFKEAVIHMAKTRKSDV